MKWLANLFSGAKAKSKKATLVGGGVLALATPLVAQFEGLRMKAYLDAVGIPTICYGETEGVQMGQVKTKDECDQMLSVRLAWFAWRVDQMVDVPMTDKTHAALASLTYNIGVGAFERSTLRRKINAGDYVGACNEIPRWNKAGGRVLTGLVKRRAIERVLCLEGVLWAE